MGKVIDASRYPKCVGISSTDAARNLKILSWAFAYCLSDIKDHKKIKLSRKLKKKYKKSGIYEDWKSKNIRS